VANEEEEEEEGGEEAAGEQNISTKICTHCISEVMQFAIGSNSSSLLELLYTRKLRTAFKKTRTQKSGNKFLCCIHGRNLNELYDGNV
jgi:hypothetical protein